MKEHGGRNHHIEQSGTEKPAHDDDRDGMENLLPRLPRGQDQRNQRERCRQGGHQYRNKPLERSANDHLFGELLAFVFQEMEVVADHHDSVAAGDSAERDKGHQGRHGKDPVRQEDRDQASDERHRDIEHDLEGDEAGLEVTVKHEKYSEERKGSQEQDEARGLPLALELAPQLEEVPFGELHLRGYLGFHFPDQTVKIPS